MNSEIKVAKPCTLASLPDFSRMCQKLKTWEGLGILLGTRTRLRSSIYMYWAHEELRVWVGGDTHLIKSPDRQGLPDFSHIC